MTTLREDVAALARRTAQEFNKIREEIGSIEGGGSSGPCTAENTSYGNYGYENVAEALDSLLYEPIVITKFSNNIGTKEMGTVVSSITFTWDTNKTPVSITLDGINIDPTLKSHTLDSLGLTSAKTWTIQVSDEKTTVSKNTSIGFTNGVYYGVGSISKEEVTSQFILGLTRSLQSGKAKDFTANPGSGEYIYYALPTRYGTPSFYVGGFEGGFDLFTTFNFTNASGYQENYSVYRSTNANLGSTAVSVK